MKIKTSKGDRTFQVINILILLSLLSFVLILLLSDHQLDQCKRSECKW